MLRYLHHDNASFEFLTCSPEGINTTSPNLQHDDFSEFNFEKFIGSKLTNATSPATRPTYVMTYGRRRANEILDLLKNYGLDYYVMGKYFHTVFPFDNVSKYVLVLRLNDTISYAHGSHLPKRANLPNV